ncbi:MAG: family transporter, partial [Modestobacter sp.]|nr:family transporter [Modestobacter sp.]
EAVEQAVVEGITRHGEDFQLVVEPAPTVRAESNSVAPLTEDGSPVRGDAHAGRPQDPRD